MTQTIQIKRAGPSGSVIPSSLAVGELAYSENGELLYIGTTGSTITTIGGGADHTKLFGIESGAQVNTVLSVNTQTGNVVITKANVSLGNVDNTSDVNKPVSTAQQAALDLKANIASPTFTGNVSGITASMVGAPSGSGTSTGTNTGDQDLSGLVLNTTTVNGHALSSNVTITASDVGLGNVTNESKATMFTNPTFTGTVILPTTGAGANEAATKEYVDSVAAGLNVKMAVRAASSGPGIFATDFITGASFGGVTLGTNDRILLKDQTSPSENGLFTVNVAGAPTRTADGVTGELNTGSLVYVYAGTYIGDQWVLATPGPITVGTTGQTWTQFGGGAVYSAGTGITLSGSTFSVDSTVLLNTSTIDGGTF